MGAGNELLFGIRPRFVVHYLGRFCFIAAALNCAPLGYALLTSEIQIAISYATLIAVLTLAGFLLSKIKINGQMQMNEAMVIVALVFLLIPLLMTVPQVLAGISFIDAFFENVSATTTTGLSTLGAIEQRPLTFQFARAWMQWYGGLGIIIFSLALIVRPGMSALRLAQLDQPDDLVGGTKAHARRILLVYGGITICGILLWIILGGDPLKGILYIFSAVSTGGFSPTSGSFSDLDKGYLAWLVTIVAVAGAFPLALYQQSWRKNWRLFLLNNEVRAFLTISFVFSLVLVLSFLAQGWSFDEALWHGPLMAFSAQTTAGFSSLDPELLGAADKMTLILAMAVGGSVGSTAGGFKVLRLIILFGLLSRYLKILTTPAHAVVDQRLGQQRIEAEEVQDALMIIVIFTAVIIFSWFPFLLYGFPPLDALFEVVSATGMAGLSSGITQAGLPTPLKAILCIDMLLGRLEFVAWMVFFYPRTWFARKREEI